MTLYPALDITQNLTATNLLFERLTKAQSSAEKRSETVQYDVHNKIGNKVELLTFSR